MTVRAALTAVLAAAALAATGCGADPAPSAGAPGSPTAGAAATPVVLRPATLRPGQPLPTPTGTPLLTVTGLPTATGTVALDRQTLGRLSQVELRAYEPWVKHDVSFRGVWLADLLAVAGVDPRASVLITALDDYSVTLSAADLRAGGILLATADGAGREIPLDQGGPTRIVFQDGTRAGANADQWIWSLRTIDVQ